MRHLFVLAGQSNMVGQASSEGQGLPDSIPEIRIWTINGSGHADWQTLRPGYGQDSTRFGLELELGATLRRILPADTFYFVKTAWSGTSLEECWRPPSAGGPGICYDLTLAYVGIARSTLPGPETKIDGIFWMQGENDAMEKADAEAYQGLFGTMLSDLRTTWGDSSIPVVAGLVDLQAAWPYASDVRAAQVGVARELERVGYVETVGLETDGIHYLAAGINELGRRMALRWKEILDGTWNPEETTARALWSRPSANVMLLWAPGDGDMSMRIVDADGRASRWEPCRVPLDFHRGRLRDSRARFLQLRGSEGRIQTLRIPALWR